MIEFDLVEELSFLQDKSYSIEFEVSLEILKNKEIANAIEGLGIQYDPPLIHQPKTWDACRSILKYFDSLNDDHVTAFAQILFDAIDKEIANTTDDIAENQQHNFEMHKQTLELLIFLLHWFFEIAENKSRASSKVTATKSKTSDSSPWESKNVNLRGKAIDAFQKVLFLNLDAIFIASSQRDLVINDMIFKSIRLSLENPDLLKTSSVKITISDIFCHCAVKYESSMKVLLNHLQDFLREDHLSEFVAEIIDSSIVNYEHKAIMESITKFVGSRTYSDKDQDKLAKSTAKFLIKLSEIQPGETIKHMVNLIDLLDSESPTIRAAMIDVIGNTIHGHLARDNSEAAAKNLTNFYEILSMRFLDVHYTVRLRVLKNFVKLTERHQDAPGITDIPLTHRQSFVEMTIMRLKDKSSHVRKKAIELLVAFMDTSPFIAIPQDMGSLSQKRFEAHVNSLLQVLREKVPKELINETAEGENDSMPIESADDAEEKIQNSQIFPNPSESTDIELVRLQALLKYYQDGAAFAKLINSACGAVADLLGSSLKLEVASAMAFFVTAHRYDLEEAEIGVKKMVHKIWDKDTGEKEAGSTRSFLINAFFNIHMDPPEGKETVEKVVAMNLIELIGKMDLAEQTSLEELLSTMASMDKIPSHLTDTLWRFFSARNCPVEHKKNAIILLGMIGKTNKEVLVNNLDLLTKHGLGEAGDYGICKYACIALQQLYHVKKQKGVYAASLERKTPDHPTIERIIRLLIQPTSSPNWYSFAEQAINTTYIMVEQPDKVFAEVIKILSSRAFDETSSDSVENVTAQLSETLQISENTEEVMQVDEKVKGSEGKVINDNATRLSQLLFVVGHVAIKQIVHLESIESEWKRRKADRDTKNESRPKTDELEMVAGTAEDEFADTIALVREKELLFGPNSLLAVFGPIISHILTHNQKFKNPTLQIITAISLCKFMCISSDYCEAHLPLLTAVLERSKDATMRSNLIIGMGDLAICFNSILDDHITYLYGRLKDDNFSVKKNTLMVLTFLILNGMIKVKGQLGEMAKCLEDPEPRIRDLSKAFFKELSSKDNAIYNNLPDIISNLSTVEEEDYKKIVKFLFGFIVKERQSESIVEKLCLRFQHANSERQWRDIGFCLSRLSFGTEKSIKKLMEYLPLYQDKLYVPELFKNLTEIIAKVAKTKQDFKVLTDDFKERLEAAKSKAVEDHNAFLAAQKGEKTTFKDFKASSGLNSGVEVPRLSLPLVAEKKPKESVDTDVEEQDEQPETAPEVAETAEPEILKPEITVVVRDQDSDGTITEEEVVKPPPRARRGAAKKPAKKPAPKRKTRRVVSSDDSD